ncbi:MAG: hypothetical protein ACE5I1_09385 [bacterium]
MKKNTHWEGKLIDALGLQAALVLNLRRSGENLSGDFAVSFLPPEDSGCCGPDRRLAQTGPVSGKFDSRKGRLKLNYEVTVDLKPVAVLFEASVIKADPHALQAMVGCYDIKKGKNKVTLDGGGCVLWNYLQSKPGRKKNG